MKFKLRKDNEEKEKELEFWLDLRDGHVCLCCGNIEFPNYCLLKVTPKGISLCRGVVEGLGLPVNEKGEVVLLS